MVRFVKRFLAIAAGIAAFGLVMLSARPVIYAMSHAFFKVSDFPGGQPPARFVVALRERARPGGNEAISAASWMHVAAQEVPERKLTFLLPGKEGTIPSQGDFYGYKVIEDRTSSQIIEVTFINTHSSWSRYEAFDDHIVPISYRTDGSILSLIPIFGLFIAGIFVGRRVTKLLRQKLAVG